MSNSVLEAPHRRTHRFPSGVTVTERWIGTSRVSLEADRPVVRSDVNAAVDLVTACVLEGAASVDVNRPWVDDGLVAARVASVQRFATVRMSHDT